MTQFKKNVSKKRKIGGYSGVIFWEMRFQKCLDIYP